MDLSGVNWHKSSVSSSDGACVEVGVGWRKSSYSGSNGGGCVEVARAIPAVVAVRDSKDPAGPVLAFSAGEWQAFTARIKSGDVSPG